MTTTDLHITLEKLRAEKYPDLDSDLVSQIVSIQADYMENSGEVYKRILQCIDVYLENQIGVSNAQTQPIDS